MTYPISFIRIVINFTPIAYPFKLKMSRYLPSHPDHGPSWCIITGPTGDLGKEFAVAFAKKGFNLLLVGRSEDKLRALVADVEKDAKTTDFEAKPHAIDLGGATEADWEQFEEAVKKLPGRVTVLINNAGVSHRRVTPFEKTPPEVSACRLARSCGADLDIRT